MTVLVLDSDIRDWVVLPLFVIIVITAFIRQYVSQYMNVTTTNKVPIVQHVYRVQNMIQSSSYLRYHYRTLISNHVITSSQHFQQLLQYRLALLRKEVEYIQSLKTAAASTSTTANTTSPSTPPASDPMMDMMMKNPMSLLGNNMIFMIQNMVMMQGIQHFFSGFILLQIPFTLTIGFKSMFQKGVMDLPHLSSSYVSSVSWYFLVLYGLRSFLSLLTGTIPYEQREQDVFVTQSMGYVNPPTPTSPNGGKQDYDTLIKTLQNEIDQYELFILPKQLQYESSLDNSNCVEQRILGERYPKRITNTTNNNDDQDNAKNRAIQNTNRLFAISQTKTTTTTTNNKTSTTKKGTGTVGTAKKSQ